MSFKEEYKELMKKIRLNCKVKRNHKVVIHMKGDEFYITSIVPCSTREELMEDEHRSCSLCIGKIGLDGNDPICCSLEYRFGLDIIEEPFMDFIEEKEFKL